MCSWFSPSMTAARSGPTGVMGHRVSCSVCARFDALLARRSDDHPRAAADARRDQKASIRQRHRRARVRESVIQPLHRGSSVGEAQNLGRSILEGRIDGACWRDVDNRRTQEREDGLSVRPSARVEIRTTRNMLASRTESKSDRSAQSTAIDPTSLAFRSPPIRRVVFEARSNDLQMIQRGGVGDCAADEGDLFGIQRHDECVGRDLGIAGDEGQRFFLYLVGPEAVQSGQTRSALSRSNSRLPSASERRIAGAFSITRRSSPPSAGHAVDAVWRRP